MYKIIQKLFLFCFLFSNIFFSQAKKNASEINVNNSFSMKTNFSNSNYSKGIIIQKNSLSDQLTDEELNKISSELKVLYFSFKDESLSNDAKINLDYNIEILKKYSQLKIVVSGHSDSRGSKKLNLHLSEKRAIAVRNYMMNAGVLNSRITTVGKGEIYLLNYCDDNVICEDAMHQVNRRVVLNVTNN